MEKLHADRIAALKVAIYICTEIQMIFKFFVFTSVIYKFPCYSQLDLSLLERSRETGGMEEERSWRI